jgi:hypothetical protein
VGEFAESVRDRIRDSLAERQPRLSWGTEHRVRRTPVDVVGERTGDRSGDDSSDGDASRFVAVELEWRRADPVNNTVKLFYYCDSGDIAHEEVTVVQVFTAYYDRQSGGVSSKREVAEFVGETVADAFDHVTFYPVSLPLEPPKRGGEWPDDWRGVADETAE